VVFPTSEKCTATQPCVRRVGPQLDQPVVIP
jgi:hypothetical protein